jgi:hypothetical protein
VTRKTKLAVSADWLGTANLSHLNYTLLESLVGDLHAFEDHDAVIREVIREFPHAFTVRVWGFKITPKRPMSLATDLRPSYVRTLTAIEASLRGHWTAVSETLGLGATFAFEFPEDAVLIKLCLPTEG